MRGPRRDGAYPNGDGVVDIFDEVSEDLRAERAKALLRRYGALLIALAVLVVLAVAGFQAWRWQRHRTEEAAATRFIAAMRAAGGAPAGAEVATPARAQALREFLAIAADAPQGYRTLALLQAAALQAATGDLRAALASWDRVSADTGADPLLRGLADLLWVQHQVDGGEPALVQGRLAPLVAPGNPWRPLALEAQAWLLLRTGEGGKAQEILRQLREDQAAPDGVRGRASGLLQRLGGAAPAPAPVPGKTAPAAAAPAGARDAPAAAPAGASEAPAAPGAAKDGAAKDGAAKDGKVGG